MTGGDASIPDEETESHSSEESESSSVEVCGSLQKWTNYIHGWQDRYFVLKDGCISYFKDKSNIATGSRGSLSLAKALVKEHEFDELRFDIGVNDCVWYCRAKNREERRTWLDAIELYRNDSSIDSAMSRNGSMFSLNSINSGNMLLSGKSKLNRGQELLTLQSEMDTLRSLSKQLVQKIELHMQLSASTLPDQNGDSPQTLETDMSLFRADCLTFKTTTDNLLDLCKQCVDLSMVQDEKLRRKLDEEIRKRKKLEEAIRSLKENMMTANLRDGPDFQEGPNSAITDEMWFDAIDGVLEKLDEDTYNPEKASLVKVPLTCGTQRTQHRFSSACDNYVKENLKYAFSSSDQVEGEDGWELMHSEGEMRVYRKEVEIDGLVLDPLKATHQVEGITAEEMCRWFFDPDVKMEWEGHLLEKVKVLEILAPDTVIIQSVMKRVWPSAQRDIVYLSHIRHVSAYNQESNENDTWIVCNYSVDHSEGVLGRGVVRCQVRASMVCQTIVINTGVVSANLKYPRSKVACKVWYTADVNPGGWAPAKVLRQIYKHEYPKFLTKFGQYVYSKTAPLQPEVSIPTFL